MTAGAYLESALDAYRAGLCPVPVAGDGTKRPALNTWRQYEHERPSEADVIGWFRPPAAPAGIGLICGAASGGLEMLELEGRFAHRLAEVREVLSHAGLGDVFERIDAGYRETTPSGGVHWLYRCAEIEGNRKIAERPAADRPNGRDVLIETRGQGGFTVTAPTRGQFEPYPGVVAWLLHRGRFSTIATVTPDERRDLFAALATFDEMPDLEIAAPPVVLDRRQPGQLDDDDRPGDTYNRETTWHDILSPDGWVPVFQRGDATYWRRPGKAHGISATTNALGTDRLKVFTTSTAFDPDRTYDRFGAYALLHHGGNLQAAARAIRPASEPAPVARTVLEGPRVPEPAESGSQPVTDVPEKLIDDFLSEGDDPYDWLIEDLLERGDRLIVTAPEGLGKSTLLRQIAAAASAGKHPFGGPDLVKPLRALIVDLENSRRHVRRQLSALHEAAGVGRRLFVVVQPAGLNIQSEIDRSWLEGIISRTRPDLVCIGPVYKMADGDPNDEVTAKPVAMELDRLRTSYGFAVLIEHHQPYGDGSKRPLRPYGWSGWSRWPEFGLAMVGKPDDDTVELQRWRGDRDARKWPAKLAKFGDPWPFVEAIENRVSFAQMVEYAREHRSIVSGVIAAGLGVPLAQVESAIRANRKTWDALVAEIDPF